MDWSDHAMWWPEKNIWLDNTRWTLDQYNINADAFIHFTPMHKTLRIQLPDLRYIDCSVDFSVRTFSAVVNVCSELEIRHPEELSLCKPLEVEHLKFNYSQCKRAEEKKRRVTLGSMPSNGHAHNGSNGYSNGGSLRKHRSMVSSSHADLQVDRIVVDRPDTNTFIAHSSSLNINGHGGNNSTLGGRKSSTLSWAGSPSRFRSLGRNGTMSLLHTPSHSKKHINDPHSSHYHLSNGRSSTPQFNVSSTLSYKA